MIDLLERRRLMLLKTEEQVDPYILLPLTFRILAPGYFLIENTGQNYANNLRSLKYNLNNQGWVYITEIFTEGYWPTDPMYAPDDILYLQPGDVILFIGEGEWALSHTSGQIYWRYVKSGSTSASGFDIEGNIASLFAGDNFADITEIPENALYGVFQSISNGSFNLRDLSNLRISANTIKSYAFYNLFGGNQIYGPRGDLRNLFNGVKVVESYALCLFFTGMSGAGAGITAVKLPNVDLYMTQSFRLVFQGNTFLTWAELPSTTNIVGNAALWRAFNGCSNLCFIDCRISEYPTTTGSTAPFSIWVNNVYSYGCFLKHPDAEWARGTSGIPTNWEVFDYTTDWEFGKYLDSTGKKDEELSHVITPWLNVSSGCTQITYTMPLGNCSNSTINAVFRKDSNGNESYVGTLTKGTGSKTLNIPSGTTALKFVLLISSVPITWIKETTSGNYLWKGCQVT